MKLKNTLLKITGLAAMCLLLSVSQIRAQPENYTFFQTGTATAIVPGDQDTGNHCDDCVTSIALPFDYTFYGTTYSTANVSDNGNLQFTGSNSTYTPTPLPALGFTDTIFVYWTDQFTGFVNNRAEGQKQLGDPFNGKGVFTSVSGVAPNRIFNIEWRTVMCCDNNAPDNNYELRLYEGQRKFDIIYGGIINDGSQTTSGVQKDTAAFTQYQSNTVGSLVAGMSITTSLEPTDAAVFISGRVSTQFDEEIVGARVTITDSDGISKTVLTNKFGNFRFNSVPSGNFYIIKANARGYRFDPITLPVTEDMTNINFTPRP